MPECRLTPPALLGLILLAAACSHDAPPEVRPLAIQVVEELVLGADESADLDAQFSFPVSISTDADGRIYVADQGESMLKAFDPDGSLAWTAGREGQGPGEFQQMRHVVVDGDRVLVLDRQPGKINWFRRGGEFGGTIQFDPARIQPGRVLHPFEDGRYLTAGVRYGASDSVLQLPALHVIEPDFQEASAHFGAIGELPFEVASDWSFLLSSNAGSSLLSADHATVYFAPWTYPGKIYRYDHSGSEWLATDTLRGYAPHPSPLSIVQEEPLPWQNYAMTFLAGRSEPYRFALHHISSRLFELRDGRIVHFSDLEGVEEVNPYVEVFDRNGNLLAHGPLPDFPEDVQIERFYERRVVHKDADDRFFVVDRSGGLPVVRVVRMEFVVL